MATKKNDIRRKTNRLKLKPQRNPYWTEIATGLHLGYRRIEGKAGRWVGRERTPDGKYRETAIGVADDLAEADGDQVLDFDQAAAKARPAIDAAHADIITLYAAIDDWMAHKIATTKTAGNANIKWNAARLKSEFTDCTLAKMTRRKVESWHVGLAQAGANERSSRASADRRLTTLLAVLNRAAKTNLTEMKTRPWIGVKKFGRKLAGEARVVRFTSDQIQALLAALDDGWNVHFKRFVVVALETGCRPSELYTARVRDWDAPSLSVDGKTGPRCEFSSGCSPLQGVACR